MKILFYISTGVAAGILAGLFGIGGGIVLVPILVLALGFSQVTASGTSLVALLLPVGILGVLEYYRSGKIGPEHIKIGLFIACGMVVGTLLGAKVAVILPENIMRRAFAVFLVVVAVKIWLGK
jgi:uncharacterized protein